MLKFPSVHSKKSSCIRSRYDIWRRHKCLPQNKLLPWC